MPGYFTTIANSPGSLEPKIVNDLELERYGLRFVRPDPTLVHPLDGQPDLSSAGATPSATMPSSRPIAPGEAARYDAFFAYLQAFADRLGISIFEPPPSPAVPGAQPDAPGRPGSVQPHPASATCAT